MHICTFPILLLPVQHANMWQYVICFSLTTAPTRLASSHLLDKCKNRLQDLACFLFFRQLKIQIQQQSQEIPVGVDRSFLDQLLQSPLEREAMVDHEVRQHQGRRAAHSHDAVHQNFPWRTDGMKGERDVKEGLARGLGLIINIIHDCPSHAAVFLFPPLWAKNSAHNSASLFI